MPEDQLYPLAIFDANGVYIRTDYVHKHLHTDGPQQWAVDTAPDVPPHRYRLATNTKGRRYFAPVVHAQNEPMENQGHAAVFVDIISAIIDLDGHGRVHKDRLARLRQALGSMDMAQNLDAVKDI